MEVFHLDDRNSALHTHLPPVGGGEDPHRPPALLHVPEEPQCRHLVGFRGHVHVDKQGGEAANGTVEGNRGTKENA